MSSEPPRERAPLFCSQSLKGVVRSRLQPCALARQTLSAHPPSQAGDLIILEEVVCAAPRPAHRSR